MTARQQAVKDSERLAAAVKRFDEGVQEFITETSSLGYDLGTIVVGLPDYTCGFRLTLAQMIAQRRNRSEVAALMGVRK
jgi:hypothetical protein